MSSYTQILYQIVFGISNFQQVLFHGSKDSLFADIGGVCKNLKCYPYIIGGHENHIHMVLSIHRTICLSDLVKKIKLSTNKMIKENRSEFGNFSGWQVGYGAFSYRYSERDLLIKYVENQDKHHRKVSFKEEIISFYKEFEIDFETKYLFV